jgi:micrococcal nuclease
MYDYEARLNRVIDGDTYVLDIDLGFHVWTTQHIRLLGIDCPERNTPEGKCAKAFAESWFASCRGPLTVETAPGQPVSFERWVATVRAIHPDQALLHDLATDLSRAGFVK